MWWLPDLLGLIVCIPFRREGTRKRIESGRGAQILANGIPPNVPQDRVKGVFGTQDVVVKLGLP